MQKFDNDLLCSTLITNLREIKDTRIPYLVVYPLIEILFLALVARICGCTDDEMTKEFGKVRLPWFRKFLSYSNGIPSYDTINRVLSSIDSFQFESLLSSTLEIVGEKIDSKTVNIDGKRIRGSVTKDEAQKKASEGGKQSKFMVNIYCDEVGLCLGSIEVGSKGGEKAIVPKFFETFDLKGSLVTTDSGFGYKDTTSCITENGAHYLIQVKNNQANLVKVIEELTKNASNVYESKEEHVRGRIEQRTCKVFIISELSKLEISKYESVVGKWSNLKSLVRIESKRKAASAEKVVEKVRYYISDLEFTAQKANEEIRKHWAIENKLHWKLDVILKEDNSRKRKKNSAVNNSIINKLAFNLLNNYQSGGKNSLKIKIQKCCWETDYLEKVLGF